MSVEVAPRLEFDIRAANNELESMTPSERLLWADETFGDGLHALTSCGTQASLVLDHINKLGMRSSVIFLNTGFYPEETYDFKEDELSEFWADREFHEFGPPSPSVLNYIKQKELWKPGPREIREGKKSRDIYDETIKGKYLRQAVQELGATALITGVHRDQTEHRSSMGPLGRGKDGQIMVRAFVDWTEGQVYDYIEKNNLPTHPLYPERTYVGDVNFMEKTECGIHFEDGKLVRTPIKLAS